MGEHKVNPIAQAAKAGLLPPKDKKKSFTKSQIQKIADIMSFQKILDSTCEEIISKGDK